MRAIKKRLQAIEDKKRRVKNLSVAIQKDSGAYTLKGKEYATMEKLKEDTNLSDNEMIVINFVK